ncbi:MAG: cytidine deaminase [Defluviitaleaceae bacterium]|nr:cytidine deaminase [Defluviitaleaceae bacterium]
MEHRELAKVAIAAREAAYVPYSGFAVGAALLTKAGKVFSGCNIENAGYSPTNCGERTAIFKAVSEGEREFTAIAVAGWPVGGKPGMAYPCGVCRQVMMEFMHPDTFEIIVCTSESDYTVHTLAQLLPHGFGPASLK